MAGLNCQDGASSGQVGSGHDVSSGTQVGGNSDALEDRGGLDEALDISHAEVVGALSDGVGTGFGECGGQEGNVRCLVRGDFLEVGVEGGVETSSGEVALGEVGETFTVEFVLEMLQGEGIVEDVGVGDLGRGLTELLEAVGDC